MYNDPHLSGSPAGIGTAAFRGCRALDGPVPRASLDKHELNCIVARFYLYLHSLSITPMYLAHSCSKIQSQSDRIR